MNLNFLNLNNLKDQLKEQLNLLWEKINENPLFNTLMENYQNLSYRNQRLILSGGILLFVIFIFSFPLRNLSSSFHHEKDFNEHKTLIHNLLQTQLKKSNLSHLPSSSSFEDMKRKLEILTVRLKLLKEQKGPITAYEIPKNKFKIPHLNAIGLKISLNSLNLTEIIDIGHRIQSQSPYIKLIGLEMKASGEKKLYFDVLYKIASFYIEEKTPKNKSLKGKKSLKKKKV